MAMKENRPRGLTPAEAKLLQQTIDLVRDLRYNVQGRPRVQDDWSESPEIYIARIPQGAIPGLGLSSSGTGSGTGSVDIGPANYVDCYIYRVIHSTSLPNLEKIDGLTRRVYNVGQSCIYGPQFAVVTKDKFGDWIVVGNGRGTEMLKVVGAKVGGWQAAYTFDYNVQGDAYDLQDLVYISDPADGSFAIDEIVLDAHLVGVIGGYRRYLANASSGGSVARYGVAQANFTKAVLPGTPHHSVSVKFCDKDGGNVAASTTTVYLEYRTTAWPNIEMGDIIPCVWNDDRGEWQCPIQDSPVGWVVILDPNASIPHGWESYAAINGASPGAGYLVLGDAIGDGTATGNAGSMTVSVFDSGTYTVSLSGAACIYTIYMLTGTPPIAASTSSVITAVPGLANSDLLKVAICGASSNPLPQFDKLNALPAIRLRYIRRIDNGI